MIVISDPSEFNLSGSVVSIGMFDGVHRGHRRVLRKLRDQGLTLRLPTVLVTFDPHPLATLRPESCPALLSTLEGRMGLLEATGHVDYCLVLKFDGERSAESADDFVRRTLVGMLGMRSLIVGENRTPSSSCMSRCRTSSRDVESEVNSPLLGWNSRGLSISKSFRCARSWQNTFRGTANI